mgnify:CR=1 FL=1
MAKMFYSLQEAASKLKKSEGDVRQMAAKGEITEFRDGDRLIFKVDQIDLLAGDDDGDSSEMSSMIPLADTGGASAMGYGLEESSAGSMASGAPSAPGASGVGSGLMGGSGSGAPSKGGSGSGMMAGGAGNAKERSGVPVFDIDELEEADPSAVTQVTDGGIDGGFTLDSIGSGSGLMDLTRESDDTSLGAEGLLDELYNKDEGTASESANPSAGSSIEEGSGLFEGSATAGDLGGVEGAVGVVLAEPYDGAGSGLAGGLALGVIAATGVGLVVTLMSVTGLSPGFFATVGGEMAPLVWVGIIAGVTLLATGLGFVIGKKAG